MPYLGLGMLFPKFLLGSGYVWACLGVSDWFQLMPKHSQFSRGSRVMGLGMEKASSLLDWRTELGVKCSML